MEGLTGNCIRVHIGIDCLEPGQYVLRVRSGYVFARLMGLIISSAKL